MLKYVREVIIKLTKRKKNKQKKVKKKFFLNKIKKLKKKTLTAAKSTVWYIIKWKE